MAHAAQISTSFGHELRACLRCRLIKTYDQFRESGCENCPFFKMDQDHERIVDCTTPNFIGHRMSDTNNADAKGLDLVDNASKVQEEDNPSSEPILF